MTFQRLCDQQRQPCPTPYRCQSGCYFNEAADTTAKATCPPCTQGCNQGRTCNAAPQFWDASAPGYYEGIDTPSSAWGKLGFFLLVIALIGACIMAASALMGVLA